MDVSELWRKHPKTAAVAAAIVVALGSSAQAQAQDQPRENANRAQTEQQVARSDGAMQTLEQYLQSKTLRVSKIVGMELQSRSGDNLGEVHDVLKAPAPGQDMQLVVQIGGIGADEKLIAVPFDEIQINSDGDELYTTHSRDQLAASPAVQLGRRATGNDATPAERTAAEANRGAADRGAADPRTAPPGAPGAAGGRSAATLSASQQRLADLVGAEVLGTGDDEVGELDDIVISTAGADSLRAVMQVGGIAGVGEKRVSVPLNRLNVDRSADDGEPTVRVAMDQAALERLPEFEYEEQTTAL